MDVAKLMQKYGGRLLRQALGGLLKEGINRMGTQGGKGTGSPEHDRHRNQQTRAAQNRMRDVLKVARRFWR